MTEPIELNYKYQISKVGDTHDFIYIKYDVLWYYGVFPWQYIRINYSIDIPTCSHPDKDKINPFYKLKSRDLPNDMIQQLVEADIQKHHIEDGLRRITTHKRKSLFKISKTITKQVDYSEDTGLDPQREGSVDKLMSEWYNDIETTTEL